MSVGLSQREYDVLVLLAHGLSSKEVAHLLGIATATVQVHSRMAYRKLEVTTRVEAFFALGWLHPPAPPR